MGVSQLFPQMFHGNVPQSSSQCPGQFWNRNWEIKRQHTKRFWTLQFLGQLSFVMFLVLFGRFLPLSFPPNENFVVKSCPTSNCEVMNWSSGIWNSVVTGGPRLIMALKYLPSSTEAAKDRSFTYLKLKLNQEQENAVIWVSREHTWDLNTNVGKE